MHRSLNLLSLVSTVIIFALISALPLTGTTTAISSNLAQTTQSRKAEANSLLETGNQQLDNLQAKAALQSFQQALTIYQEIKDRQGEANALKRLGDACLNLKEYTKAIAFYQQSLAIAKAINARELEGRVLNNLGLAYKELEDTDKAIEYYQQALVIAKEINNRKLEQIVLNNLGYIYVVLENPAKVVEYYQQVLVISQELQDRSTETSALAYLGDAYASLKENQKAIDFAQQALILARGTKNSVLEAIALDTLTRAYSSLDAHQKTLEFGQQALTLARQLKNQFFEVRTLVFIGDTYVYLNDYQKAIDFAQQALILAQKNQNLGVEVLALDILMRAYSSLEAHQKTLEFGQQALTLTRQLKNPIIEGRALIFTGNAYNSLGEHQKAIDFAQQSITLAQASNNPQIEGLALAVMADAYDSLWDYQKAVEYAQKGLEIARTIQKKELEAYTLVVLGSAYNSLASSQEEYEKAINFTQQALILTKELKDRFRESRALSILGSAYNSLEDYQKSIEFNQQALAIAREIENPLAQLFPLANLSTTYINLGDYQKAIEVSQQGLVIAQQLQNSRVEWLFTFIPSLAYFGQGNLQKSLELSEQSLATLDKLKSSKTEQANLQLAVSLVLSIIHADLENYEKAVELSEQALAKTREIKNPSLEGTALNFLGQVYIKSGRKEQAMTTYQNALVLATTSGIAGNKASAQFGLARIYGDLNMPLTAITYYKQSLSGVEEIRGKIKGLPKELQESFLQAIQGLDRFKTADVYRELADLLLSQGRILEAQQVLELLKVQELRDFTRDAKAIGNNPEIVLNQTEEQIKKENGTLISFGQKIYECQQTQCSQLSQLLDQRQTLTEQFNQKIKTIEKEIRDRRAKDDAFFDPNKLSKAKEIVEAQPGTILIYPLVLPDKIWILWTAKGGIIKSIEVPKIGQKQIGETVLKFRQLLQSPTSNITELKATAKQLYDWLIKPIEPELKANKIQNLVFSLDRATRYIPMSALFDGEKYLVENYAVSLVLSADLTDTKDRLPSGTQNTPVLALGLSKAVAGYNALPNVPAELNAIVRKKPNDTTGIYPGLEFLNESFDFRALRDNLIGRKILHVATHGQFVPGRQEDSYLLLGKGEKLTITQIKTLQDLSNIHLVVLSACETALGEPNQDGVEINGISFSFLNAGAKAVMASLWLVNDASTSLLMQKFYSNLAQETKPITKAAALRQAQLSLLRGEPAKTETTDERALVVVQPDTGTQTAPKNTTSNDFSHPYYWAPFILIGNGL